MKPEIKVEVLTPDVARRIVENRWARDEVAHREGRCNGEEGCRICQVERYMRSFRRGDR